MSAPVQMGTSPTAIFVILLVLVVLGAGWWFVARGAKPKPPPTPTVTADVVVAKFLTAKRTGLVANVRPFMSADSLHKLDTAFSGRQARSAGFDKQEVANMFVFDQPPSKWDLQHFNYKVLKPVRVDAKNNRANVAILLEPIPGEYGESGEQGESVMPSQTCEVVLVNEGGHWKVDIVLSSAAGGDPKKVDLRAM